MADCSACIVELVKNIQHLFGLHRALQVYFLVISMEIAITREINGILAMSQILTEEHKEKKENIEQAQHRQAA